VEMPFGEVDGTVLDMRFSSADFSVASVLSAVRERLDMLNEMGVSFLGIATEVATGPTPVFQPVAIKASFQYLGRDPATPVLERTYEIVWEAIVNTFPAESEWAKSKEAFGHYITAQADLLRARLESTRE
jgi:hypothetical protein